MERRKKESNAWRQIFTALLATIPTFTYGIQIGWLSPLGDVLKAHLPPDESPFIKNFISWMAAALPLAAICGIPFFSYASDRFGRKLCVIAVSLLSTISWIIKLTSFNAPALIIARVIAGLAAGGCFVAVPVYIKEISEDAWRGALGSLSMAVCKFGVIFVYAVGMSCSYYINQIVYLSISAGHALLFAFMPESPNYLLKKGREEAAIRTISWLRNVSRKNKIVAEEISKLREEQKREEEMPKVSLLTVVHDKVTFSALRMTLVLMAIQTLSGCFALMNYAANVFARAGTKTDPNTLALFVGSLQLIGSFLTTMSIEKFGRKIPLAISSLTVSICMGTLATSFLVNGPEWLRATCVCVCLLAYGAGLAPVPLVIMAEVFTFQFRSRMAGASMMFSFFCSSMTVLFYAPVADKFGEYVVFYTFAAVTLYGVIYTVFWVPETKGKSLQEIQRFWKKDDPVFV